MASYQELLDAIARVGAVTGDSRAWLTGLSDSDIAAVTSPVSVVEPNTVEQVVAKIRAAHRAVFDPASPSEQAPAVGEGRAADAIRMAETSLAQQNSRSAQLDLQVITAVLNAHATNSAGREALDSLQRDLEAAVATRTDLDTPAGARAFQRYLIEKLHDIKAVVETAGLDATSKATLAAALASLYVGAPGEESTESASRPAPTEPKPTEPASTEPAFVAPVGLGSDPLGDALLPEDLLAPPAAPVVNGQPPAPMAPPVAGIPPMGGGAGSVPAGPALAPPTLDNLASPRLPVGDDADLLADPLFDEPLDDVATEPETDDDSAGEEATEPVGDESTVVNLPNGETVTAPNPQLAAANTAAVAGTPIPEAFRQQGITIPAPGTAVAQPVDAARLTPGDIGILTDRHALALGNGKAVLNNQIQPIASITGPTFLGWEHPPEPGAGAAPPKPDQPAPTRPAVTADPSAIGE